MKFKSGSLTFGTTIIKTDEYVMLAKIMTESGQTVPQAALQLEALDNMLVLIRIKSMLNAMRITPKGRIRKDSDFLSLIDKRMGQLVTDLNQLQS